MLSHPNGVRESDRRERWVGLMHKWLRIVIKIVDFWWHTPCGKDNLSSFWSKMVSCLLFFRDSESNHLHSTPLLQTSVFCGLGTILQFLSFQMRCLPGRLLEKVDFHLLPISYRHNSNTSLNPFILFLSVKNGSKIHIKCIGPILPNLSISELMFVYSFAIPSIIF